MINLTRITGIMPRRGRCVHACLRVDQRVYSCLEADGARDAEPLNVVMDARRHAEYLQSQ